MSSTLCLNKNQFYQNSLWVLTRYKFMVLIVLIYLFSFSKCFTLKALKQLLPKIVKLSYKMSQLNDFCMYLSQ